MEIFEISVVHETLSGPCCAVTISGVGTDPIVGRLQTDRGVKVGMARSAQGLKRKHCRHRIYAQVNRMIDEVCNPFASRVPVFGDSEGADYIR